MSIRSEKVSSLLKRIIATPVSELAEEFSAGLATVTSVRLSKDLHVAKVYVSVYGAEISGPEFIDILEKKAGEIRTHVGANVRLRHTPELRFYLDDTLDQMEHIQNLLDKVKNDKPD